jgi:hypothetical protein
VTACHGLGGNGIKYTYAQLQGLWINAGGPAGVSEVAAAIALAESGGCSTALNPSDNGGTQSSFGLWQISNGTHNPSAPNIYNGAVNAKLAVGKYKAAGNRFTDWGTYVHGAYKAFLKGGSTPDTNVPTANGGPAADGSTPATLDAATAAADTAQGCLIALPKGKLFLYFGPQVGGNCLLAKSGARGMLGGVILASGSVIMGTGLLLLGAYGLRSAGAGRMAGGALEGAGAALSTVRPGAGLAVARGGQRVRSQGAGGAARGATLDRARRRQAGGGTAQQRAPRRRAAAAPSAPPPGPGAPAATRGP